MVACTPDRLELRGHRAAGVGIVLGGLGVCALGVLDWWAFLTNNGHASMKALVLPFVAPFMVWAGVAQLRSRLVFDRNGLAMWKGEPARGAGTATGAGPGAIAGAPEALFRPRHAVVIEILPTNMRQRESVKVGVEGPGAQPVPLGVRRTNERDAATLLAAAGHIANLIDAPVRVIGDSREGSESFGQTLDALRALEGPIAPESLAA